AWCDEDARATGRHEGGYAILVGPLKLGVTHGAQKLLFSFGRGACFFVLFTPPTPDSTEVPGPNPTQTRDGAICRPRFRSPPEGGQGGDGDGDGDGDGSGSAEGSGVLSMCRTTSGCCWRR
ncbi:unnamed protein product, partial [Ectocarpus sp. 6 AP-2014]